MKFKFNCRCAPVLAAVASGLGLLLACGSDETHVAGDSGLEPTLGALEGGEPAPRGAAATVPRYDHRLRGEIDQGYLVPVRSLEPESSFNLDRAIEVSPDAGLAAVRGTPYLYVGSGTEPTITRWVLQEDDTLQPERVLSLGNLGLSRAAVGEELFLSPQKAYIPDDANQQLVVWNPEAMEIVGTIALNTAAEGALQPSMSVTVRQDAVIVVVSWQGDFDGDWSQFGKRVRVIQIDPRTDRIVSASDESRCNYLFWGSTSSDGTAYFSPLSYYAPIRSMLGDERGVDSCGLRVVPPGATFDTGYQVDLSSLVEGRPAGNLFMVDDDVAFLRVWHSDLVTPLLADKSNWQDVINEPGFLWWRWRVGAPAAELIGNQEPGASETTALFTVDLDEFLPRIAADYSSTTLDELDPSGTLRPTLSGPGNLWSIVRMH